MKFYTTGTKLATKLLLGLALVGLLGTESCRSAKHSGKPRVGWFKRHKRAASAQVATKDARKIIETAKSYTGTRYMLGGTSHSGMDCSGLVLVSYRSVGKELPRQAVKQSEAGRPVGLSNLSSGDLVFFTDRKGNSKITHVGIVVAVVDNSTIKFIHTTNSLGVVENNLLQPYWQNLFLKAVRVM